MKRPAPESPPAAPPIKRAKPLIRVRRDRIPPAWARRGRPPPIEEMRQAHQAHQKPQAPRVPPEAPPPPAAAPSAAAAAAAPPALEPSFVGVAPYDDMIRVVSEFIFDVVVNTQYGHLGEGSNVEIEAKLGIFINKDTNDRILLPGVETESVVNISSTDHAIHSGWVQKMAALGIPKREMFPTRFQGGVTPQQYGAITHWLNQQTAKSQNTPGRIPIQTSTLASYDRAFELSHPILGSLPKWIAGVAGQNFQKQNLRVRGSYTPDHKLTESIIKVRIADLDIHLPHSPFDVRLSINIEHMQDITPDMREATERISGSSATMPVPARNKDRVSYTHQGVRVDLTKVHSKTQNDRYVPNVGWSLQDMTPLPPEDCQVELELNPHVVVSEGTKAQRGEPNTYEIVVGSFLNNIRWLARGQMPGV